MALKCFIAMAFEREDTDKLYDKTIEPLLKRKGISQFRVDRSNRNDDIDDQILSELRKCDFVIADLTYARPSVYFEAGIAQGRPVPVIYTCRRDHFKHQPDDEHGNFRVHFDLQMKPIIPWSDPPSVAFSRRLEKRIALVVRPLLSKQQISEAEEQERLRFANISVSQKRERLEALFATIASSHGFRKKPSERFAWKRKKNTLQVAELLVDNTFTKKEIIIFLLHYGSIVMQDTRNAIEEHLRSKRLPLTIERHVFFCSLRRILESRVSAVLPNSVVTSSVDEIRATRDSIFVLSREKKDPSGWKHKVKSKTIELPLMVHAHFITGIFSEQAFSKAVGNILRSIDPNDFMNRTRNQDPNKYQQNTNENRLE